VGLVNGVTQRRTAAEATPTILLAVVIVSTITCESLCDPAKRGIRRVARIATSLSMRKANEREKARIEPYLEI
jgi:hypothetical protein